MKIGPKRILIGAWFAFSTLSTVISIASLAEDLIAWNQFILGLIRSYRDIVNFIWGGFFSIFDLHFPQFIHDYLTINALCATAVTWALYSSSVKLGFGSLGSFWLFLKNNLASVTLAASYLSNFAAGAEASLKKIPGAMTEEVKIKIQKFATPHRSALLVFEAVLAIVLFLSLFWTAAFFIPPLMYWLDIQNCNASIAFMTVRRAEIESSSETQHLKSLLLEEFDIRFQAARDEVQIVKLYHNELWKSLLWYFVTVVVAFLLVVLSNYLAHKLG